MQSPTIPYRQIRASYTPTTIIVYQAYSASIACPAVETQRLDFSPSRMTWIKPSWAWMLYRSGYSYKDSRQAHILAIHMTHTSFISLLRKAVLSHGKGVGSKNAKAETTPPPASVRVQWDPERSVRLDRLSYRSIQIGIPGAFKEEWLAGIVKIEDVTERARELKALLDMDVDERIGIEALVEKGLVPAEKEFEVDEELRGILEMD
jgi:hypothetical protein